MQYYRHYKGNYYRLIGEARHSETQEDMIVYQAMYKHSTTQGAPVVPAPEGGEIWVRPKSMFYESVVLSDGQEVPRFAPVSESEYQHSLKQASAPEEPVQLLDSLYDLFQSKGYSAEDFYGGCSLCGDVNEFALDIIETKLSEKCPNYSLKDKESVCRKLYRDLQRRFEEEEM